MVMSKADMQEWKVCKNFGCGELGPTSLATNKGHRDNTLNWKDFHKYLPQLEYFTEDMIDLDSDAFKHDEFYAKRAEGLLPYFAPFVEIVRILSASEVVILKQNGNTKGDASRKSGIQQKLAFMETVWAKVNDAYKKAKKRYKVVDGGFIFPESANISVARCLKE